MKTFAIIKPDAVAAKNAGKIIDRIEAEGFKIVALKKIHMDKKLAEIFYAVHKERPFFTDLVKFMTSAPCVVMVLEKDNAVKAWRDLMGATNPKDAPANTLRKLYGVSIDNNAVHGSDAEETARDEINLFFAGLELI